MILMIRGRSPTEAIQENKRELQRSKKIRTNKLTRKRETTAKKKTAIKIKKAAKTAGKKNNKKGKKTNHSATINKTEEDIVLLFQNINYRDPNEVEA